MRKSAAVAFALVTLFGFAPPAVGQSFFFDAYCVMGSLQACASVRVFSSGNTITMQVWNLFGVHGTHHTLSAVGLYHSGGSIWSGSVTSFSAVHVGPDDNITSFWSTDPPENSPIHTLGGVDIELAVEASGNDGIVGCGADPGGGDHWATCGSFPSAPYVEFTFGLSEAFSLDNLELRWHSQQMGANFEESTKCDTGGAGDYPDCTFIPEPTTMVLLATGLLGIGGAGLIRRRKGYGVRNG